MINLRSRSEIQKIRSASQVVAEVLSSLSIYVIEGVDTFFLDQIAESLILKRGASPAFKGYRGFKHTLCVSINEEVVHGIPSKERRLKKGDIVGIDCGVLLNGYYGDGACTFPVGDVSSVASRLIGVAEDSLLKGIQCMTPEYRLFDIGAAVQFCAESSGFSVVRDYVGHGIGLQLHEDPQVPNYGKKNTGFRLKEGMVFAIEPMINVGDSAVELSLDGWTVLTKDRSLSAHFEHTVAITGNGPEILTRL